MRNLGQQVSIPIKEMDQGLTLLQALTQRAHFFKKLDWRTHLDEGRFLHNEEVAGPMTRLAAGDRLIYLRPPWQEPAAPTHLPTLFEDERILAVDKPAGLPVTPSGDYFEHSVIRLLRSKAGWETATPAHRLDLETSGVLLLIKQPGNRGHFQTMFQKGLVKKTYVALVHGHWQAENLWIDFALAPDKDGPIFSKQVAHPQGKPAKTRIVGTEPLQEGPFSLVRLEPLTGRTNQLRAHLALMGHPIVGDKKYHFEPEVYLDWLINRQFSRLRDRLILKRQALHAQSLELPLEKGGRLSIHSQFDAPAYWRACLTNLT